MYPGGTNKIVAYVTFTMPLDKISARIRRFSVTPASAWYATWALTLSTYLGSETVVFGTVSTVHADTLVATFLVFSVIGCQSCTREDRFFQDLDVVI